DFVTFGCHWWYVLDAAIRVLVTDTNCKGIETVQNIQLGQTKAGNRIDLDGAFHGNGITPAGAALTTCSGTKFMTFYAQVLADFTFQFRWERTRTDPGGIGFYNT